MHYIKIKLKGGGHTYFTPGDNFTFTLDGRAYGYPPNRSSPIELDAQCFTPARYEAVIMHQSRQGWVALVDMTQPGRISYINNPEEPEVVLDPGIAEAGQAVEGLAGAVTSLAAAGFEVKAPQ